ncbi:MAG: RecT family recombinase [Solirubrobacterales bacterium]|jgi:phage recombination protein Bet
MADEEQTGTALTLTPVQQAAVREVSSLGKLFHMEASGDVLADVLIQTAFSGDKEPTPAQLVALVVVAKQYRLNPFTKEIYAYPDKKKGIVPIVGVDGWIRIINEQPMLDGIEFDYSPEMRDLKEIDPAAPSKPVHEWVDCIITRKDRDKPIVVREYFDEVYKVRGNYDGPWQTHPKRFHRHKVLIQCARVAFGFAGIYDPDEADRVIEQQERELSAEPRRTGPARPQRRSKADAKTDAPPAGRTHDAGVDERAEAGDQQEARAEDITDAEFEPVADEQPNAADERAAETADDGPAPTDDGSLFGGGEGATADDWQPEPGQASEGTLEFIRRKGEAKGYDAIALCQRFELNALRGITEEKASEILGWLKTAPAKEVAPA